MKRPIILVVLFLAMLGLSACQKRFEWNQKLTVVVETPDGEKSGSAVVHEIVHSGQLPMSASAVNYEITGEATIVEVAPGRYLFALLNGSEERAARTWPGDRHDIDANWKRIEGLRESRLLPGDAWPTLVTFDDVNNPKSVRLADPENLSSTFGPGFALKEIRIEITDEKVTVGGVEKVLGWLANQNPVFVDWKKYPFDHPLRSLNKNSFSIGN